uniref:C2H2-type domain-containing protein n=1 Tax=Nothobranchius furzeri TaxID=105023 RepID=A0A8C6M4W2_NOTFU
MTSGIAAVSFFSNACRFTGCGLHFDSLSELIVHIEDDHIGKSTSVTERRLLQQLAGVCVRSMRASLRLEVRIVMASVANCF